LAVSDGLDTRDETTKISVTVKSLVNELYLDDLRKTTNGASTASSKRLLNWRSNIWL